MSEPTARKAPRLPGSPKMLNHLAYVTHDVESTVDFYERIMGMPMVSTVIGDRVPSTGDAFPYFHVFFRMSDGSTVAFFEAPGLPPANPKGHPAYDIFDHLAFEVTGTELVDQWHNWLVSNDIDVVGPTDHGIIYSIYFHDNNGIRLEITTPLVADWNDRGEQARRDFEGWITTKREAGERGQNESEALLKFIADQSDGGHQSEPV